MSRIARRFGQVLLAILAGNAGLRAQQHPQEPTVNLGDTSFLDALGAPGLLIEEIGDASHSGAKTDGSGQVLAGAPGVNSISGLTHGVVLTKQKLFGAWWGFEAIVVAARVNAGSSGVASGLGDLTISPLVRSRCWKPGTLQPSRPGYSLQCDGCVQSAARRVGRSKRLFAP